VPQVEEGLNHLPVIPKTVQTPTGAHYDGVGFEGRICGVSILRSGEVCVPLDAFPFPVPHGGGGHGDTC
jgi:uracil phosphoribosyltransferase